MNKPITQAVLAAVLIASPATHLFAEPAHDHAAHDHADHAAEKPEAHADEVKLTEAAIKQNNVRIGVAEEKILAATFVAPARVAYNTEAMAHVGSVVSGRIVELKARTGDKVKKGDDLLIVESPELGRAQSDFLQRRTDAEVAVAAVAPAKDAFSRAKKLYDESQGIAYSEVQKRETDLRAANGSAASAKAAMQAAENGLHLLGLSNEDVKKLAETGEIQPLLAIKSPIDGQVIEREVTLGELVSPDKEKLMVVADTDSLWLLADVPEGRLADIGVGSTVQVQIASLPGEKIDGKVSLISAEVDATTRTARLRIPVANPNGKIRPGMFARALIQAAAGEGDRKVVAVPEEAVLTVEGKPGVFVPVDGEPNTFARREVVVGRPVNGFVAVSSGLKAGESLVISGAFILKAELGKSEAGHEH